MKCRRAKRLVFDFIDGMISDRDRLGLEQHLAECDACERLAGETTKSLDMLHRLPPGEPDENFTWKVRLRIARERNAAVRGAASASPWVHAWNRRFAASALAAFVVMVAAGYTAVRLVSNGAPNGTLVTEGSRSPYVFPKVARKSPGSDIGDVTLRAGQPGRAQAGPGSLTMEVSQTERPTYEPQPRTPLDSTFTGTTVDATVVRQLFTYRSRVERLHKQLEALQVRLNECEVEDR